MLEAVVWLLFQQQFPYVPLTSNPIERSTIADIIAIEIYAEYTNKVTIAIDPAALCNAIAFSVMTHNWLVISS